MSSILKSLKIRTTEFDRLVHTGRNFVRQTMKTVFEKVESILDKGE